MNPDNFFYFLDGSTGPSGSYNPRREAHPVGHNHPPDRGQRRGLLQIHRGQAALSSQLRALCWPRQTHQEVSLEKSPYLEFKEPYFFEESHCHGRIVYSSVSTLDIATGLRQRGGGRYIQHGRYRRSWHFHAAKTQIHASTPFVYGLLEDILMVL